MHRKVESCNSCHRKIDPMGFPLESFNPIGQWRDSYPNTRPRIDIDPSTTLADGRQVADIVALKELLLERKGEVTRCLTEKLLTYAAGREFEPSDRGEVDHIVEQLDKRDNGLRDLVKLVVQSEIFLTK